jgi:hypothetical protein
MVRRSVDGFNRNRGGLTPLRPKHVDETDTRLSYM